MIIRASSASLTSRTLPASLVEQRWFQALFGVVLAIILPLCLNWIIWPQDVFHSIGVRNSATAAFAAFFLGLIWHRRLVRHPGVQGVENVLYAFIATFAMAAAFLLLARLDYSRVFLFSSFVFTLGGFAVLATRLSLVEHPHFQVLPFGSFERLLHDPHANWTVMHSPEVPLAPMAGLVADLRADMPDEWQRMMADAVLAGIPVFHLKQIEEALSGRVDIEHMSENQFGSLIPSLSYFKVKSLVDMTIALLLLPFFIVPFAIVALLIKLDSPGPVFYLQPRVGEGGRMFRVIKFRSMRSEPAGAIPDARESAMTQSDDARITRVGKYLRRCRIDELSQIFNILKGEMSWIGPRPEAQALSVWYRNELPFYQYRHVVRPGITGWAQVNQGHVVDLEQVHDKLRYDFYYIKYFSVWLDLLIAIRTIRIVIGGFGAK